MRRDPRVTLTIVDPENAYSYVELRGRVEFEEGRSRTTRSTRWPRSTSTRTYPWAQPASARQLPHVVERELGM